MARSAAAGAVLYSTPKLMVVGVMPGAVALVVAPVPPVVGYVAAALAPAPPVVVPAGAPPPPAPPHRTGPRARSGPRGPRAGRPGDAESAVAGRARRRAAGDTCVAGRHTEAARGALHRRAASRGEGRREGQNQTVPPMQGNLRAGVMSGFHHATDA